MIYFVRRILQVIPVLFIVSFVVFIFVHVSGDPVALMLPEGATEEDRMAMREELGLNEPVYVQYGIFVKNAVQGEFGRSLIYDQEALPIVLERMTATFQLLIASIIVSTAIALPLGVLSAIKKNTVVDLFISSASVLGKAMPNFWLGMMFILIFSVYLQILPVSGRGSFLHIILPAVTAGTAMAAQLTRMLRSHMLEVLSQDYIRTARSKGLSRFIVIYKHALRNALLPVVTIIALQVSTMVGGALITETVFAWPGLGQLVIQAVQGRDMALVQACVLVIALFVIAVNLIADLLYRFVDPRIKYD